MAKGWRGVIAELGLCIDGAEHGPAVRDMRCEACAKSAARLCRRVASHGPATRGTQCEACADKQRIRDRRKRPATMDRERTHAFWQAMREWYASGGWRVFR